MVSAKKGTLLRCDVPTKVYVVHLNSQYKAEGKKEFIIADLDEQTLLINPSHLDEIRAALKKYSDGLNFEPTDKRFRAAEPAVHTFHDGFKAFLRTKYDVQYKSLMAELTASFTECSRRVNAIEATLKDLGRSDLGAILREIQNSERDKLRLTLSLQALKQAAAFRTFSWQQPGKDGAPAFDDDEALALLDPQLASAALHHAHGHSHTHAEPHGTAAATSAGGGAGGQELEPELGEEEPRVGSDSGEDAAPKANGCGSPGSAGASHGARHDSHVRPPPVAGAASIDPSSKSDEHGHTNGHANGGGHGGSCGCGVVGGTPEPSRREYEAAVKEAMQALDACIRSINDAIGK